MVCSIWGWLGKAELQRVEHGTQVPRVTGEKKGV